MARIRTIKPEFWADEKLGPMSMASRLTFLGLISMADDMGRVLDNVKQIDAFVFPYTDDSSREALAELESGGRVRRGAAANGLRIIQIVNWHHQKIDKPNFASCLPAIEGDPDDAAALYRRNKRIPDRIRDQVWERDHATCQACGKTPLRRDKRDRYDAGADLGEIDHRQEAADGGSNEADNLQLLCLPCNRKKAGVNVSRRNDERSATTPRRVDDGSAPHTNVPRTVDLRPSTSDRGAEGPAEAPASLLAMLPTDAMQLLSRFYEFPGMTPAQHERYRSVAMQLVDAMDPTHAGPKIRGGVRVKARSAEHMAECCRAVMRDPPMDRDVAVLWVLKKLTDPVKGPSVSEAASRREAVERQAEETYELEARAAAIQWAKNHPDEYAPILAEVEATYRGKSGKITEMAKASQLTQRCATAAGFPPFDDWQRTHRRTA